MTHSVFLSDIQYCEKVLTPPYLHFFIFSQKELCTVGRMLYFKHPHK